MALSSSFANRSLKTKLMASMLVVGVVPLLISSVVMNWQSGKAIESLTLHHVEALAEAKKSQFEEFFGQMDNQLKFLSEDQIIVEAMTAFTGSFQGLGIAASGRGKAREQLKLYHQNNFIPQLEKATGESSAIDGLMPVDEASIQAQLLYIAENPQPMGSKQEMHRADDVSAYTEDHASYHSMLKNFAERFGYYDIFLIEPENGTIVYSVFKELDFATSLEKGPFKESGLAEVYRKARLLQPGQSALVDYKNYLPSFNAPASFMAAPIYTNDKIKGVLVFQIPGGYLNSITHQSEGMGESGEIYLIGKDGLMRSQSRLTDESTLLRQINVEGLEALGSAQHVSGYFQGYRGEEVVGAYSRLNIPGLDWQVVTEIESSEVLAPVYRLQIINVSLILLTALLAAFAAWRYSSGMTGRVNAAVKLADSIANGKFDNAIEVVDGDEIDDLQRALNKMQTELFGQMREKEVSMNRIKAALDNAGANVMVADSNDTIIYLNNALRKTLTSIESELRTDLPNFRVEGLEGKSIDEFHRNPQHQRHLLSQLRGPHAAEISVGGCILELTMRPIVDENGERLGTVTEWIDLTSQRASEKDLEHLIACASAGVLDQRLNIGSYQGFYKNIAQGLNDTLDAIAGPLTETRRVMESLAEGNLNVRFSGDYQGEFKLVEEAVNTSTARLSESMNQLNGAVSSLGSLAHELARDNTDLHERTTQQSSSLQATASAMEEITGTVVQNTENAQIANGLSNEAVSQASEGNTVVMDAIDSIRQISESSEEIASITEIINEIAFQTNLLALNAAVEAARAGEQGRGFAVVASEVRALAGRSAEAAKQIENLIKDSILKVERGTEQVHRTGDSLKSIVDSITKVSSIVGEIAAASEEQTVGISEVNGAITRLESVTQNNLSLVGEISGVSDNLNQQATDIREAISVFKMEDNGGTQRNRYEEFA